MKWLREAWHDPVGSQVITWALIGLLGLLGFWMSMLVPPARVWVFETLDRVTRAQLIGWLALGVALGGALSALIYHRVVRERLGRRETSRTLDVSITTRAPERQLNKSIATKGPERQLSKSIPTKAPERQLNKSIPTKAPERQLSKSIATKAPERQLDKSIPTRGPERELNKHERAALKYLAEHEGARVDVDDFPDAIELNGLQTNQVLNELVRRKLIVRSAGYPYQCWLTDQGRDFAS